MLHKTKNLKIIATVLLLVFTLTFALPTNLMAAVDNNVSNSNNTGQNPGRISSVSKAGQMQSNINKHILGTKNSLNKKNKAQFHTAIANLKKDLAAQKIQLVDELAEQEQIIQSLKATASLKRARQFKAKIEQQFSALETNLQEIEILTANDASFEANQQKIKDKVETIEEIMNPEVPMPLLGSDLPHQNVELNPPTPATGGGISAAYTTTPGGTHSSGLPFEPGAEDLEEGAETAFTTSIDNLASLLEDNPVEIYNYVRNNIEYEPYYGSRKGATGTVETAKGNGVDQASLLIALLRYKGIPARYVTGTIEMPIDQAAAWLGVSDTRAATRILSSSGIPVRSIVSGGKVASIQMEHTWVEAYVPYSNYRGTYPGKGEKAWIPLDPSFKQYMIKTGLDIQQIAGVDLQSITEWVQNTGQVSPEQMTITGMDLDTVRAQLQVGISNLETYLQNNELDYSSLAEIFGGKEIIPQYLDVLPASLPYEVVTVTAESRQLPSDITDYISFNIQGSDPFNLSFGGTPHFSYQASAPELFGKRITLSWVPATSEDEAVIQAYGGIFNTPAYLVEMIPQLKIDGQVAATGRPVGLGYRQQFSMTFKGAGMESETVSNPLTVGGIYAVNLDYQEIAPGELSDIAQNLHQMAAGLNEDNLYTDAALGEILNGAGKTYFMQVDLATQIIAQTLNVSATRMMSSAITGYLPKTFYTFMCPVRLDPGSMYIDVDRDLWSVVSNAGQDIDEKAYMIASGIINSAMEHGIWEELLDKDGVSSIKILEEANRLGIPIYTVTNRNIDQVMPLLQVSKMVKTDITNAVNRGRIVTIPQTEVTIGEWQGAGYIVLDPESGAAAYMIGGGIAGGSSAWVVNLTALAGLIISITDLYMAGALLMVPGLTSISGLVAVGFITLASIQLVVNLNDLYSYYIDGNPAASEAIITNAVIGLAGYGILATLKQIYALRVIKVYGNDVLQLTKIYGDDAAKSAIKYGDNAVIAMKNGIDPSLISKLDDLGIKPDDFSKCGIVSKEGAEAVAEAVQKFIPKIKVRNIVTKTAEEINEWWRVVRKYTNPPYTPSSIVLELELEKSTKFVRLYHGVNSEMKGQWFMKAEDVAGLTSKQLRDKFALPYEPKYIVDLQLPAGSKIRAGETNPNFGFTGKGTQFEMMGQDIGEWVNPRLLPE